MIDLTMNQSQLENSINLARDLKIMLPTFEQMKDPSKIPESIKEQLKDVGLWDVNPLNLFRINWRNEAKEHGGAFKKLPNYIELPSSLTGVEARIFVIIGRWFPTGAHKVGAAYGCLVPRLVTGQFDPTKHEAVWPSTGNYCRGGAFDSQLLGCKSIAILPEEMSKERFEWLYSVAGEVIKTPGSESNVKEIYDKCHELEAERGDDIMIFNQFAEFGNHLWHYQITGDAMASVIQHEMGENDEFFGSCFTTGSAGTIAAGDYLKKVFPTSKIMAGEALQCPTLLQNGFGAHRIEGIGDKHVPWIHNMRTTDMVIAIDDNDSVNLIRLFNEPEGRKLLKEHGVDADLVDNLDQLGISSIANILMCIKTAKYFELGKNDMLITVATDSMDLYKSRLSELEAEYGKYTAVDAMVDFKHSLLGINIDNMLELGYKEKQRIHNLKYFTWIEQQGMELAELNAQWYDYREYWSSIQQSADAIDEKIKEFNEKVGLL
ncbi:MAG: pyridoxal-phosphate dependent enzyme [Candidatus Heimdallarchaeota archaeon]|nr:pyridoxal-phosphate dependent enzyme [Candidatus Heimdallarchaeota archaeon]